VNRDGLTHTDTGIGIDADVAVVVEDALFGALGEGHAGEE
jgi:hypothetical protein